MSSLPTALKKFLKKTERLAIVGVGSDLRADDVVGELIAQELKALLKKKRPLFPAVRFFFGKTAPENLTGEIRKFRPSHVLIIDAADLDKKPGTVRLFSPDDVAGASFSTHRIPAKVLVDYLTHSLNCTAAIIGIQPKSIAFGQAVSKEACAAVRQVVASLAAAIKDLAG
jgi:hydrogenase 3 maturation protease